MAGMTPVGGDAHLDVPLSNLALSAFNTGVDQFIADQLFPMVNVGKQSDKFYVIEKDHFFMIPSGGTLRAPKTEARRIQFTVSSDSYFCHNYALAHENSLEDLANADMAIALRENSVRVTTTALRRDQEIRIANVVTSATNVGSGVLLTGGAKWNDYVNSDPIANVTTAHAFIMNQTGLMANTMVIDWHTLAIVRRHPIILDMYKYTSGGEATDQQLREVFKVDRIMVGKAIKNVAKAGQVASMQTVWGNNVLLAHLEAGTGLQTSTLGLRFGWQPAGFVAPFGVERRVESGAGTRKVEIIETGYFQSEQIVAPDLGYLIANTL